MAYLAFLAGAAALPSGLNSLFSPLVDARSPGLAVLVRKDGHSIFQKGYGVADLRTGKSIDARTNFRLASCSKQFTALAAMLLVHDQKLKYDTRLADIFPDFPNYARGITIRHLLTHTSGLPDYEDLMNDSWSPVHQIQDEEVLALLKKAKPKFEPGTNWAYSNSGYVLLGLIVSRTAGMPFPQFLHDRIFGPLHMAGTIAYVPAANSVSHRAFGHTKEGDRFTETDQSATSATLGDGGIYSNVEDLAKWDAALDSHTLLPEPEMKPALQPVQLQDGSQPHWPQTASDDNLHPGKPVSYGFGWFLDPYNGHPRMWHFGSTMGFRTAIERFTGNRLTIIVLCNRTDLDPGQLALQAADQIMGSR